MTLFDPPRFVPPATYEQAIAKVVWRLAARGNVRAVYQLGGTGSPGISDIDLLVVSSGDPSERTDPFQDLDEDERYLFTHDLFGIPESGFQQLRRFTMYHNYRLLWGDDVDSDPPELDVNEQQALKQQIAFEFLLSTYIARTMDLWYGAASIRGLLLSGHALRYDLEFLGIRAGRLFEMVSELISWRSTWFERHMHHELRGTWLERLVGAVRNVLDEQTRGRGFYLPIDSPAKLASNISLERADAMGFERKRVPLPTPSGFLGKTGKKFMNRVNRFSFKVPYHSAAHHPIVHERLEFLARMATLKDAGGFDFQIPSNNVIHMILRGRHG
ncbi:MAG TPA: hypothetical protein VIL33_05760 [Rhodothermia bacterium]